MEEKQTAGQGPQGGSWKRFAPGCTRRVGDDHLGEQPTMHFDDAFDFLIGKLAALPDLTGNAGSSGRTATYGCDIWVPQVVVTYWQQRIERFNVGELTDEHYRPFYDAAWELARIGVLRPGPFLPRGQAMGGQLFSGDGFSITKFGREWLKAAGDRPIRDPSRLADRTILLPA